jgi:hypothetical protein
LTVVATEAQGWTYDQVSCISGKAWDTKYLKLSDQFIEDEGKLGHMFTSADELEKIGFGDGSKPRQLT